ncbi:CG5254 [Drosophila busckii]|uniref:Mitochondrial 2-oxodicarboxylate carrier n=1 Tax=Drosophila busckii TaxID=30019 RepID=A0A0M4EXI0_DROBS|nr:mitochondrial 2-oxodicarboxylate carrier [Drosophila busckii]XP_017852391.1 mitochondrial 2-oxodicarboxylate carrier [Drosophila busckii]ALC48455.1 CG5254 [Drosophila busckii]
MASHHADISPGKRAVFQVMAGGSAGFLEVCIMQPLDVVKTRMQIQAQPTASVSELHYNGVFDCFAKMYRHEGLGSYWKGLLPPVLAETPKRAIKFLVFEQTKQLFQFGSPTPTPLTFSLAGLTAGLLEAVAVNPFEVVKVAQQADRQKKMVSTFEVAREIVKRDGFGLRGLNKGVTATMGRNGVFNMVYFGFYHSVKNVVPESNDNTLEFLRKVAIGFTAGTLACFVNIPFDVAKSRIQGPQPVANQIKYRGTLSAIRIVYAEEGFRALYKGLVPKIMRLGPGGAIMLLVFDYAYDYLLTHHA